MALHLKVFLEISFLLAISVIWCEVGYYYFKFHFDCGGWPDTSAGDRQHFTRILVISDTHIMGPIKSARFDKWRREWEMKQAFSISNNIYNPDVIIFLGDLFDEASFSMSKDFEEACRDFREVFPIDLEKQTRIVIAGNHDVGFHHQMVNYPILMQRFREHYSATSSINLLTNAKLNNLNIVVINSMSFHNDSCPYCSFSKASTAAISNELERQRKNNPENYTAPILFSHIPLYRLNDTECDYPDSLRNIVVNDNKEGRDVLHQRSSLFLLQKLKPRLILSGHTHMECITNHVMSSESFEEHTVSSYNHKYAESQPGFLLLSVSPTTILKKYCTHVEEIVIISIYAAAILSAFFRLLFHYQGRYFKRFRLEPRVG